MHRSRLRRVVVPATLIMVVLLVINTDLAAAELPSYAIDRAARWFLRYRVWTVIHYGLGLLSVVLSVVAVAYKSASSTTRSTLVLLAAVASGVLTFLNPLPNAKAFHQAWQLLDNAVLNHRVTTTSNDADLVQAIREGEKILDDAGVP